MQRGSKEDCTKPGTLFTTMEEEEEADRTDINHDPKNQEEGQLKDEETEGLGSEGVYQNP